MTLTVGYITLRNVRFHAFHGVLPQERRVGADFLLSLKVTCPIGRAIESDEVDDTLSYAALFDIAKREMAIPSQLLEHVAGRVVKAVAEAFPAVTAIDLELLKQNPPMGADCDGAGVEMHWER